MEPIATTACVLIRGKLKLVIRRENATLYSLFIIKILNFNPHFH